MSKLCKIKSVTVRLDKNKSVCDITVPETLENRDQLRSQILNKVQGRPLKFAVSQIKSDIRNLTK